jgi:hypothetical protein
MAESGPSATNRRWSGLLGSLTLVCAGCFSDDVIARLRAEAGVPAREAATEAASVADAAEIADQAAQPEGCSNDSVLDGNTLAFYDFESVLGTTVPDRTGQHVGELRGGAAMLESGPGGCGSALDIHDKLYVYIPDAPDWQIPEGSVDLWVKLPTTLPNATMAVISRDAHFTTNGDFTIYVTSDGTIVGRLQRPQATGIRCSTRPAQPGVWTRVGFNFGPQGTALYVNGELGTDTRYLDFVTASCGTDTAGGLDGNHYPFVIGASLDRADAANTDSLTFFLAGGAVDDVRISNVRRAY